MVHPVGNFADDGTLHFAGALNGDWPLLSNFLNAQPRTFAGLRLRSTEVIAPLLSTGSGSIGRLAASVIGPNAKPVRAILFDKTAANNWSLGWHQDRTIVAKERQEVSGFGPWTVKNGLNHVAPPFDLLDRMVTLRAHFDDVGECNAPLLIAPGSHKFGQISVGDVEDTVKRCGTRVCHAASGDVWLYSTPILHASKPALVPSRRRVLQVDYSADALPAGLEWQGL